MTTLGIRYLTGCSVAADVSNPRSPEWPPHPGRVFMALAAAHFETRGDALERQALEWLEQAGPPKISASDATHRSFAETYVPVNDAHGGIVSRGRQPRSFPTARPDRDSVYLVWDATVPDTLREPLAQLCDKVTRLGHSSSLVQMWLAADAPELECNWAPDEGVNRRSTPCLTSASPKMRIAEAGTLRYLFTSFNGDTITQYAALSEALDGAKGKEKARLKKQIAEQFPEGEPRYSRPRLTRWQAYLPVSKKDSPETIVQGPFDPDIIVLSKAGASNEEQYNRAMGMEATLQLTATLRDACMKAAVADVPEWLSGHQPNGQPSKNPHVAFFPLPFVGAKHADGHIMGLAMAIPRRLETDSENRDTTLRRVLAPLLFDEDGMDRTITLWRGNVWKCRLERETRDFPPMTLRASTWTAPSDVWASITPVVLHHYPKPKREGDVERILLEAFESADLPKPVDVRVQPVSVFTGAGYARGLPPYTEGGEKMCRYQIHAVVKFPVNVRGPVLVGRGRFRGYGLFRPLRSDA